MSLPRPRSAYAKAPAKLPALQGMRVADPQTQKALEALREWVEVRLGARGDRFEKAVTLREFDQLVAPILKTLSEFGDFRGDLEDLRGTNSAALPVSTAIGFAVVGQELYFANGSEWLKVSLTAI